MTAAACSCGKQPGQPCGCPPYGSWSRICSTTGLHDPGPDGRCRDCTTPTDGLPVCAPTPPPPNEERTMENDPVEAVIAAYLDHLESDAPQPSLDHLAEEDRQRAQELITLMLDGRGIDIYRSAPSLDMLLAGTEFEDWLT